MRIILAIAGVLGVLCSSVAHAASERIAVLELRGPVDANALRSVKETQSAISEFRQTVEEAQTTLEEVVRAEIKARMRSHEKLKSTQETGVSKLGSNIEMVRNEAAARLEGAMKSLVGRADIVDEKIENVQREMVTTLANQSRSQALVNSEMLGRLDAVENKTASS